MFSTYKHSSPKTPYEKFMINTVCAFLEMIIPSFLSANSVSLIGQIPVWIFTIYVLIMDGC